MEEKQPRIADTHYTDYKLVWSQESLFCGEEFIERFFARWGCDE